MIYLQASKWKLENESLGLFGWLVLLDILASISLTLSTGLRVKVWYPSSQCLAISPYLLWATALLCYQCLYYCDYKTLGKGEAYRNMLIFPPLHNFVGPWSSPSYLTFVTFFCVVVFRLPMSEPKILRTFIHSNNLDSLQGNRNPLPEPSRHSQVLLRLSPLGTLPSPRILLVPPGWVWLSSFLCWLFWHMLGGIS